MPNTPILRVETCCMPPKKSAWRFENTKLPESQFVKPENSNYNMGLMSDDREVKRVSHIQFYPIVDTFSHFKQGPIEDAPLDFSLKKCDDSQKKSESISHLMERLENYELKNDGNMVNHPPMHAFYPANMVNGNHSPPYQPNNSPTLDTSRASSSCKDSDSIDMDYSQESVKSPRHLVNPSENRMNDAIQPNSSEHQTASRENTPVGQSSILEEMLRGQQQANLAMANRPQGFGAAYGNGFGVYEGQVIASPSPPVAMATPVMHPASMLPLTMAPYFGYGYVDQPNPFIPGYMYNPPEQNMTDISANRKSKRKVDPFSDSLKACSVEELRKKLDSLSNGSPLALNSDYNINLNPAYNVQEGNGRSYSNNTSHELAKDSVNYDMNNCPKVSNRENSEKNNTISSHNVVSSKNNENSSAALHNKPKEISQNTENLKTSGTNNTTNVPCTNVPCTEDTNDSQQSAIQELPSDGRRKKPNADYRDDPDYRLKRAKNNLAARRSRESRRIKEEIIRKTAAVLEQQNKVIMRDITALRLSYDEAKVKYFSLLKEYENMKIQNSVLTERLNQKRCGQCGSALPSIN